MSGFKKGEGALTWGRRFWNRIDRGGDDECWQWSGGKTGHGYGVYKWPDGKRDGAHRIAYTLFVEPIPEGLTIDHLCRNTLCVNPAHLEPVTIRENILRGTSPVAESARKTHCSHDHPLSGENLYVDARGRRSCKTCRRNEKRRNQKARRARAKAALCA